MRARHRRADAAIEADNIGEQRIRRKDTNTFSGVEGESRSFKSY